MLKQFPGAFVVLVPNDVIMPPMSDHTHLDRLFLQERACAQVACKKDGATRSRHGCIQRIGLMHAYARPSYSDQTIASATLLLLFPHRL